MASGAVSAWAAVFTMLLSASAAAALVSCCIVVSPRRPYRCCLVPGREPPQLALSLQNYWIRNWNYETNYNVNQATITRLPAADTTNFSSVQARETLRALRLEPRDTVERVSARVSPGRLSLKSAAGEARTGRTFSLLGKKLITDTLRAACS